MEGQTKISWPSEDEVVNQLYVHLISRFIFWLLNLMLLHCQLLFEILIFDKCLWLSSFIPKFEWQLNAIRKIVSAMSGKCAEQVRVVASPYRICPLGAHIDHQVSSVLGSFFNNELWSQCFYFVEIKVYVLSSIEWCTIKFCRVEQFQLWQLTKEYFWGLFLLEVTR